MNLRRRTIALEGPCCAGKTTLGRQLLGALTEATVGYVPDYSDHVGGGRYLPPAMPDSLQAEAQALDELLCIEADRSAGIVATDPDLLIIDRSVHTLAAHCHALQAMTGIAYGELAHRVLAASRIPIWPELVIYLDIPAQTIDQRNRGKFPPGSLFIDPQFNHGIRSYFRELAATKTARIVWLDATQSPPELRELVVPPVRGLLQFSGR